MDARYWNEALETRPWKEVERWQAGEIARALPGIRSRSPMYRHLHQGLPAEPRLREFPELAQLPFTMKDDVRAAQDVSTDQQPFGRNQAAELGDIIQTLSSSGTTGRPMYYALTRSDSEVFADAIANTWYTAGLRPGDVVAHLVGLPMVAGGLPYADGFRRLGANLAWLGGFPTDRILREMRRLRCSALLATTSFGLYLAEQWDAVGRPDGRAFPPDESALRRGAGAERSPKSASGSPSGLAIRACVKSWAWATSSPGMWAECEHHDGMHFNGQRTSPSSSSTRHDWRACCPGRRRDAARSSTPPSSATRRRWCAIAPGDHALVTGVDCACGRTSPRIRCIGRTDDMLIYKGMNVFPTALRDLITCVLPGGSSRCCGCGRKARPRSGSTTPSPSTWRRRRPCRRSITRAFARPSRTRSASTCRCGYGQPYSRLVRFPRSAYKNSLLAVRGA